MVHSKEILGGTRCWTKYSLICSWVLYSWVTPPHTFMNAFQYIHILMLNKSNHQRKVPKTINFYFKKILGGTRSWTMDLSICSRMLYHWAIPPHISTKVLKYLRISMVTKYPKDKFQKLSIWTLKRILGGTRSWTMDLSICSRMLYHWAIPPHV